MRHPGVVLYLVLGCGLVGLYGAAEVLGWESGAVERAAMAPDVRQSPGGWRSWSFWHSGLHGGK